MSQNSGRELSPGEVILDEVTVNTASVTPNIQTRSTRSGKKANTVDGAASSSKITTSTSVSKGGDKNNKNKDGSSGSLKRKEFIDDEAVEKNQQKKKKKKRTIEESEEEEEEEEKDDDDDNAEKSENDASDKSEDEQEDERNEQNPDDGDDSDADFKDSDDDEVQDNGPLGKKPSSSKKSRAANNQKKDFIQKSKGQGKGKLQSKQKCEILDLSSSNKRSSKNPITPFRIWLGHKTHFEHVVSNYNNEYTIRFRRGLKESTDGYGFDLTYETFQNLFKAMTKMKKNLCEQGLM